MGTNHYPLPHPLRGWKEGLRTVLSPKLTLYSRLLERRGRRKRWEPMSPGQGPDERGFEENLGRAQGAF